MLARVIYCNNQLLRR